MSTADPGSGQAPPRPDQCRFLTLEGLLPRPRKRDAVEHLPAQRNAGNGNYSSARPSTRSTRKLRVSKSVGAINVRLRLRSYIGRINADWHRSETKDGWTMVRASGAIEPKPVHFDDLPSLLANLCAKA